LAEQADIDYQAFSFYKIGAFIRVSKSEILTKQLFACNLRNLREHFCMSQEPPLKGVTAHLPKEFG
jgi:hypothetical protein